ncbi:tetratricopeptide repeat-containing sensor histidine kinase [Chitinophaga filiformis]|uniref:histidine kinase n=1 Tax=Chitinophaga filiformis TaxID=104663 RepID=A0A1G7RSD7_CHIFI|nr:histidine kinase dimerization/phosphoacceptor domain -containing protein [Chitinophaga filiformis]SDG13119.1 Two-component sensor histidine kinase, contains HisKA and HATPase domains [Chitinophaga filiformis]
MRCKIILAIYWTAVLLLLISHYSLGQDIRRMTHRELYNYPSKQLLRLIDQQPEDSVKVKLLIALGTKAEYKPGSIKEDMDTAREYLGEAERIIYQQNLYWMKSEIAELLGVMYYNNDEPEKGRAAFRKGIEFCSSAGYKEQEASLWVEMAKMEDIGATRLACLNNALKLFQSTHNRLKEAETLKEIADVHLNQGKYELSESELNEVLRIYKAADYKRIYFTYDLLSAVYHWKGDFVKAQESAMAAIQAAEKQKDSAMLGTFYWRLAVAYKDAKNYEKNQEFLKKSLAVQLNHPSALLYHVLGELTDQLIIDGQVKEALDLLLLVNKKQPPADIHDRISLAFSTADCYLALKDYEHAESYYLRYADILGSGDDVNTDLIKICRFYLGRHQHKKAAVYLKRMLEDDPVYWDLTTSREISLLRFRVDSASGNLLSAMKHLQRYNKLADSAFAIEKVKQAEEMQAKFDLQNKEKDNELLREQSALQAKTIEKETLVRNGIIAGCIILLLLLALLYNRYRSKIKTNAILQSQQAEIRKAYAALEKLVGEKTKLLSEKEFLLKEIHHRVKNNLQLTMSLLNTQSKYLNNEAAIQAINDSQHRLKSISLVHQKLYQGENEGLINIKNYIYEMLEYLKDSFGAGRRIRFNLNIDQVDLDVGKAVSLGLILNEAVTNIFKYAFPGTSQGQIDITLRVVESRIFFSVSDNGVGLPPNFDIASSGSLGLSLIHLLSTQLEGELVIESNNGVQIGLTFDMEDVHVATVIPGED